MAGELVDPGLGGAARSMWRTVYRKAVEAAEPRIRALLQEHVYSYHLQTSGGGGPAGAGGGRVLLYEHLVEEDPVETYLRLPASGPIPQTHASLELEVRCRTLGTGTTRDGLNLRLNDDHPTFTDYYDYAGWRVDGTDAVVICFTDNNVWEIGSCPRGGVAAGVMGTTLVRLNMYARDDAPKTFVAQSQAQHGDAGQHPISQYTGGWYKGGSEPITCLNLGCNFGAFAAGSLVRLWGLSDAGALPEPEA